MSAKPRGKTVLVACEMLEDEVRAALERAGGRFGGDGPRIEVDWVERGFHEHPEKLRAELQARIERAEAGGAATVLLAFGLCGQGAVGLHAERARLAMPRFDDCVNLLLCPESGRRGRRAFAEAGVMYLTGGWTRGEKTLLGQRQAWAERYGERRAARILERMYAGYRAVSVIDDGCFEPGPVRVYAHACAAQLGVGERTEPGSIRVLEKLVSGAWDADILVKEPGERVGLGDFDVA